VRALDHVGRRQATHQLGRRVLVRLDAFAAANGLSLPTSGVAQPASAVMMGMAGLGNLRRRRRK
jgi:hypothetical protein